MTDLLLTLPNFPTKSYTHLIPSLERTHITTSDLLILDPLEVAKRARLPLLDVKRLINHISVTLQGQLGIETSGKDPQGGTDGTRGRERRGRKEDGGFEIPEEDKGILRSNGLEMLEREKKQRRISLLDEGLDDALAGGVKRGGITEFVGESGSGKTQLLLTLLLSVQLFGSPFSSVHDPESNPLTSTPKQPQSGLYISTEALLPTTRLQSILSTHPLLRSLSAAQKPSLDRIHSIQTPDLESQDHIIYYQVPVAVKRYNVGLVVIDSIAANYRAERVGDEDTGIEISGGSGAVQQGGGLGKKGKPPSMGRQIGERAGQIIRLGRFLQELARREGLAVVVSNQVADRFLAGGGVGEDTAGSGHGGEGGNVAAMQRGVKRRREEAERSWMSSPVMRDKPVPPSSLNEQAPPFSSPSPGFLHPQVALATTTPKDNQRQQQQQQQAIPQSSSNLPLRFATTGSQPSKPQDALLLDHQLRFFTGWGDTLPPSSSQSSSSSQQQQQQQQQQRNQNLKTPCLGLPWANQLMCRVALIKEPAPVVGDWRLGTDRGDTEEGEDATSGTVDIDASTEAGTSVLVGASAAITTPFHSAGHGASIILAGLTPAQRKLIRDQEQNQQEQQQQQQQRLRRSRTAYDDEGNPVENTAEGGQGGDGGSGRGGDGAQAARGSWHRYFKVVFSGYTPKSAAAALGKAAGKGFEIWEGGVRSL